MYEVFGCFYAYVFIFIFRRYLMLKMFGLYAITDLNPFNHMSGKSLQ